MRSLPVNRQVTQEGVAVDVTNLRFGLLTIGG